MRIIAHPMKNRYVCDDGETYTLKELAKLSGISLGGIQKRVSTLGLTHPDVLNHPTGGMVFGYKKPVTFVLTNIINGRVYYKDEKGEWYTAKMVCEHYEIKQNKFRQRMINEKYPVDVERVCLGKRRKSGPTMNRLEADGWVNGFKRSEYCQRETGECLRYNHCLDAMCINPAWKKPVHECYDAPRKRGNVYQAIRYSL